MKKLQILAFTMLFALVGVDLSIDAADGCAKGWKKNKNHVCVKVSAKKIASNKANKATKKVIAKKFNAEQQALNAINAYNAAIKTSSQNSATAAQRAAMSSIKNVLSMYNNYLASVQSGVAVVFGATAMSAQPTPGANTNQIAVGEPNPASAKVSGGAYVSLCADGSTATCSDGSEISGIDCGDGTNSDMNGMCGDGSLVTCSDGISQPTCDDYTSPYLI